METGARFAASVALEAVERPSEFTRLLWSRLCRAAASDAAISTGKAAVDLLKLAHRAALNAGGVSRETFVLMSGGNWDRSYDRDGQCDASATAALLCGGSTASATAAISLIRRSSGGRDAAVSLLQSIGRWEDALAVLDTSSGGNSDFANSVREAACATLNSLGQVSRTAALKEAAGDVIGAAELFLRAGVPGRAASAVGLGAVIARGVGAHSSTKARLSPQFIAELRSELELSELWESAADAAMLEINSGQ